MLYFSHDCSILEKPGGCDEFSLIFRTNDTLNRFSHLFFAVETHL